MCQTRIGQGFLANQTIRRERDAAIQRAEAVERKLEATTRVIAAVQARRAAHRTWKIWQSNHYQEINDEGAQLFLAYGDAVEMENRALAEWNQLSVGGG